MKTITLSVIILSLFSIGAFPQPRINTNAKQHRNRNGTPLNNASIQWDIPCSLPSVMTTCVYDSVRALTEINSPDLADAYPWISPDGLRLYYTSDYYNDHLVFTQRANTESYFVPPTVVSSAPAAVSRWLSADELDLYMTDFYSLYYAHRDLISLPFNAPVTIHLLGTTWSFIYGASLNAALDELFLYSEDTGIIEFSRSSDTSFTYTRTLPAPSGFSVNIGQLSKDALTIFFDASYNGGKSLLYQMTRTTPTDTFDIGTFQQIQGINDTSVWNGQPSMSDSLNWVAFIRSRRNLWRDDDLYLAHKGIVTSVFNPDDMPISSSAFPNPASDYIVIWYKPPTSVPINLSVYSSAGTLVFEDVISPTAENIKIDTRAMMDGLYVYRLSQFADKRMVSGTGRFMVSH